MGPRDDCFHDQDHHAGVGLKVDSKPTSLYQETRLQQLHLIDYYVCSVQFHNMKKCTKKSCGAYISCHDDLAELDCVCVCACARL